MSLPLLWWSVSTMALRSIRHERRIAALRRAGTEVEYHKYKNLGHGFGLGTGTSAEGWIDDAIRFWEKFTKNHH